MPILACAHILKNKTSRQGAPTFSGRYDWALFGQFFDQPYHYVTQFLRLTVEKSLVSELITNTDSLQ